MGIFVILWVLEGILVIFRFYGYFGNFWVLGVFLSFLGFGDIFVIFLGFWGILVIFWILGVFWSFLDFGEFLSFFEDFRVL